MGAQLGQDTTIRGPDSWCPELGLQRLNGEHPQRRTKPVLHKYAKYPPNWSSQGRGQKHLTFKAGVDGLIHGVTPRNQGGILRREKASRFRPSVSSSFAWPRRVRMGYSGRSKNSSDSMPNVEIERPSLARPAPKGRTRMTCYVAVSYIAFNAKPTIFYRVKIFRSWLFLRGHLWDHFLYRLIV